MCTIYNNIKSLCDERGVKPGRMCVELGMSKSILTGLKNGTKKNIQTDTAQKIADYFGVTVDRVLGAEKKTAHATRHTYATRAVKEGLPPEILQKVLGHADYSTTANIYTHIDPDTIVEAVTGTLLTKPESGKKKKP